MKKLLFLLCCLSTFAIPIYAGHLNLTYPDSISPLGETRDHLEKAYNRLCSPPLSELDFVLSDISFKYKRRFSEYSGDVSGRMIGALHAAENILGVTSPILQPLLDQLKTFQKSDGHFGVDQNLAAGADQKRDMPILWGNGRMLLALAEYCRDQKNPELLAIATKLGDYVVSTRPYYGKKENFEKVGGSAASGFTTCYPSLIDGLTILSEITHQQKYADEARYIAGLAQLDKEFTNHHSHGRMTAYRGMLEIDRLQGTSDFTAEIAKNLRTIKQKYQMPTGGITEMFDLEYPRDEGCAEADWIRINYLLWQATGNSRYLDEVEFVLRNHLYAVQMSNGSFGHHVFTTLTDGTHKYPDGGITNKSTDAYWCCAMHDTQLLSEAARWGIVCSNNQYYITWLSESKAEFTKDNQKFSITVTKKTPVSWVVELKAKQKTGITLNLRIPGWASSININGEEQRVDSGWFTVSAEWNGTQIYNIHTPMPIRLTGPYQSQRDDKEPDRLFSGPDMYTLPLCAVSPDILSTTAVPQILFAEDSAINEEIPVLIQGSNGKYQNAKLVPMAKRPSGPCVYLFNVRKVNDNRFKELLAIAMPAQNPGHPVEILAACTGDYKIYCNNQLVADGGGSDESPRITLYTKEERANFDVFVSSKINQPGFVFRADRAGKTLVSSITDCSVYTTDTQNPSTTQDQKNALLLVDKGPIGITPWDHVPGHFLGTEARWIWPEESPSTKKYYQFHFSF